MANQEHLALLKSAEWNAWFEDQKPPVRADLANADLEGANLRHVNLQRADLRAANLRHADLTQASLRGADLTGASMGHVKLFEADLCEASLRSADLHGANLSLARLEKATLFAATIDRAILHSANLSFVDLRRAILTAADLSRATLVNANLTRADLTEARLNGANLFQAVLHTARLVDADFTGAFLSATVFAELDLRRTKGLDSFSHSGPSIVDFHTLEQSGQLPSSFLRGCGLPERLIESLPSLLNASQPIQLYSCFISYTTKDQDFADRLCADLRDRGVRCWFAPHDIRAGQKIHEQIDEAIRAYDRLLLILSTESMASEWVATEIAKARKKEAEQKRQVLFPISLVPYMELASWELFDADRRKDSAREIREYYIPDFSGWRSYDAYAKAFDELMKGLENADAAGAAST